MAVRAITIAREFGSGGATIARMLADRLSWRLLDNELLKEIARAAHVDPDICKQFDERCDPWFRGLVRSIWRGSGEWPAGVSEADLLDSKLMTALGRQVIEEAVRVGNCVIVGRGAQCILQGHSDAFHVFVYAPMELRKQRTLNRIGPRSDLENYIREHDRYRATYIQRYFGMQWCNPHLYDLMINTVRGDDAVVSSILSAAGLLNTPVLQP